MTLWNRNCLSRNNNRENYNFPASPRLCFSLSLSLPPIQSENIQSMFGRKYIQRRRLMRQLIDRDDINRPWSAKLPNLPSDLVHPIEITSATSYAQLYVIFLIRLIRKSRFRGKSSLAACAFPAHDFRPFSARRCAEIIELRRDCGLYAWMCLVGFRRSWRFLAKYSNSDYFNARRN